VAELNRQATNLRSQRDQLLNLRLLEEIERETFAAKDTELRDRIAQLTLRIDACDRRQSERGEVAAKAFELSQTLADKWLKADYLAKRQLLDIVCLNLCLDDVTLVPEMRKPFDALAEGLILQNSRGDPLFTEQNISIAEGEWKVA
jgi:site-specific DNA recombinase